MQIGNRPTWSFISETSFFLICQLGKRVIWFWKQVELGPRYIGIILLLPCVGKVDYQLDLLEVLGNIHNTFHFSQFRKCLAYDIMVVQSEDI